MAEEPGMLQSMGSQRVGHDWATSLSLSCIREGNGNPLQCYCLENPRDRGAWWAAVYGVTQSRTWRKQLSSSSSWLEHRVCQGKELDMWWETRSTASNAGRDLTFYPLLGGRRWCSSSSDCVVLAGPSTELIFHTLPGRSRQIFPRQYFPVRVVLSDMISST